MALLEEAAKVDDQQVVAGTLGALDELARLGRPELAEAGIACAVVLAQLRVRRKG